MLSLQARLALYNSGLDEYAQRADAEHMLKSAPNDDTRTKYGKARIIDAARKLGPVLLDEQPVRALTELARRCKQPASLLACALACPPLPDGTPGPVSAGLIDTLVGTLYYDWDVPVYPEAIVVVRPTTPVPGVQTRRRLEFGITRGKHQSLYTAFGQAAYDLDNRRDYALAIGALLSPTAHDLRHPPAAPELAMAIERTADYLAPLFGHVARRIDALRFGLATDPAWLFSENRVQLEVSSAHSMTGAGSETLARQPGFGQAFRREMGARRSILIHVSDERSGGSGLYPTLRYQPPLSARRLTGDELERALGDPQDPMHSSLRDGVWAWAPDLPGGIPARIMSGELIDTRTDERFILVVANKGYYKVFLAIPYADGERPRLSQLELLKIALAIRAWEGDSPYPGIARRRSTEYVHSVSIPALDPNTRLAAFLAGATASARTMF